MLWPTRSGLELFLPMNAKEISSAGASVWSGKHALQNGWPNGVSNHNETRVALAFAIWFGVEPVEVGVHPLDTVGVVLVS